MSAPWLYDVLNKEDGNAIVENGGASEGDFLIHKRETGDDFIMILYFRGKCTRHLVACNSDGHWTVNKKKYFEVTTLADMVEKLRGKVAGWPVKLGPGKADPNSPAAGFKDPSPGAQDVGSSQSAAAAPPPQEPEPEPEPEPTPAPEPEPVVAAAAASSSSSSDGKPDCYWGAISREEAASKIGDSAADGTFLIRDRDEKPGEYILALRFKGKTGQHLLKANGEGVWTVNNKKYGDFGSMSALVTGLASKVPGWPVILSNPINKSGGGNSAAAAAPAPAPAAAAVAPAAEAVVDNSAAEAAEKAAAAEKAEAEALAAARAEQEAADAAAAAAEAEEEQRQQDAAAALAAAPAPAVAARPAESLPMSALQVPVSGNSDFFEDGGAVVEGDPVMVSGRLGFAEFINGKYECQAGVIYDDLPTYRRTYTATSGYNRPVQRDIFLFYSRENQAWAISHHMGSRGIVAYCQSSAERPDGVSGSWKATDRDGAFVADDAIAVSVCQPGITPFRCALQATRETSFYRYALNQAEVSDLCSELSSRSCRIACLKLYANGLSSQAQASIIGALTQNDSVTHLQIRDNGLNDATAKEIGDMLKRNKVLRLVSLRDNNIGNEGAKWLAEGLRGNNVIEGLSLRSNNIGDMGAELLADALKVNTHLKGLALYDNTMTPKKATKLKKQVANVSACTFEVVNPSL